MVAKLRQIDHKALETNQAAIIALLVTAFILDLPWLVALVSLIMLVGTAVKRPGFAPFYCLLRALKILEPDVLMDNLEPHRFSQGLGGVVLAAGIFAWMQGSTVVLWSLIWLVIALAALNLFAGFCVGCAVYYWLNRLSVPGFSKSPPPGTVPDRRPTPE